MTYPERRHWAGGGGAQGGGGYDVVRTVGTTLATGSGGAPAQAYQPGTSQSYGVLAWQSDDSVAVPVTLMLGGQMPFSVVGGIDWVPAYTVTGEACILIEYGAGNASNKIKCDIMPGAVTLPPSTFVKVSVVVRPTAVMALFPALTMQASLVQGTLDGIEARYTYFGVPDGTYVLPPQAVAVGLNTPGTLTMIPSGIVVDHRWDASPAVLAPPWSPVDLTFASSFSYARSALYAGNVSLYAVVQP